jgi:hypothetical protein
MAVWLPFHKCSVSDQADYYRFAAVPCRYTTGMRAIRFFLKKKNGIAVTHKKLKQQNHAIMITNEFAQQFAQEWIAAWNAHDLDRILHHYTDDFTIETPMAAALMPGNTGVVTGKDAVRAYWTIGLERIPNLEFDLKDVLAGINGLTIYYENKATGRRSAEHLFFNEAGKVERVFVHYA